MELIGEVEKVIHQAATRSAVMACPMDSYSVGEPSDHKSAIQEIRAAEDRAAS